jgi:glycosyltransferase involved in cell wall biosynthesis
MFSRSLAEMTARPQVSVVMSVYNGADCLGESIASVLTQEGVELELIVVDDGSTDDSAVLIKRLADHDSRVRFIQQHNQGLTLALIHGCAQASGKYIARQDAGDMFLPGKLMKQIAVLEAHPAAALVSCGTRIVGPGGETLYELRSDDWDATERLLTLDAKQLRGPFGHGSVVFRRSLYEQVGGYRAQFYLSQDLDLWIRLGERGKFLIAPDILFQAIFSPASISGDLRSVQIAIATLILECARLRRAGLDEEAALKRAGAIRPERSKPSNANRARALYFIGQCLRKRDDPRAAEYFRKALRANPLHLKSAVRLLTG